MAQPARAMDPFTLKQIRIRQERVTVLLWNLEIECAGLKQKAQPFIGNVLKDDLDKHAIELLERWLEGIRAALPLTRYERIAQLAQIELDDAD